MVINSKGKIYEDVLSQIINSIIKVKDLYIYSAHKAFLALKVKKNENNPSLAKLCIYIIGELSTYLINNNTLNCKNEPITVSDKDILALLKEIGIKHNNLGNETVIEYLLNALVKLFIKLPDKRSEIEAIIKQYKRSYFSEVQSRALEYLQFNKSDKDEMKKKMVEAVPLPKKEGEEDKDKDIDKKLIDEKDEEYNDIEDDLICVRLTEGAIKNIDLNKEEKKENVSGLDFLDDNSSKNINANNQGGNLDLLDLNNIFSAAAGGDQNANNNNSNNSNNNSMNPFDLLNMQLNQPNNTNNNNQPQNNNNINDLLSMVMGSNNNPTNNNNDIIPQVNPSPNENTMKECFKNEDVSIYYSVTKKEGNNIDGSIFVSNNTKEQITELKIVFLVPKFVKLTVLDTSGNTLEPSQSLGIEGLTLSPFQSGVIPRIYWLIATKFQAAVPVSHEFLASP